MRNSVGLEDREAPLAAALEELEAESALPNAQLPDDADDLPLCAERPLKRGLEDSHLSLAPHELGEAA